MNNQFKSASSLAVILMAALLFSCGDEEKIYGLDSAAKYGAIKVTFEGTRPDEVDFKVTNNYKFVPEDGLGSSYGDGEYFYIQRHHGAVRESHNDNYFDFTLYADGDTPSDNNYFDAETYILFSNNTYVNIDLEEYNFTSDDISEFSYNAETHKLKVKFTYTVDGEENATGYDLTITVEANVTVYEGPIVG